MTVLFHVQLGDGTFTPTQEEMDTATKLFTQAFSNEMSVMTTTKNINIQPPQVIEKKLSNTLKKVSTATLRQAFSIPDDVDIVICIKGKKADAAKTEPKEIVVRSAPIKPKEISIPVALNA